MSNPRPVSNADPLGQPSGPLEPYERRTRAFIVRVWLEPRELEGESVIWRGVIEAVAGQPAGDDHAAGLRMRRGFTRLEELVDFMIGHLKGIGIPEERLLAGPWTLGAGAGPDSEQAGNG